MAQVQGLATLVLLATCLVLGAAHRALPANTAVSYKQDLAGRVLQQAQAPDFYSKLVTIPSAVYGLVKKKGHIPPERYEDKMFNHTIFREWLLRTTLYGERVPGPAPMAYKCGVFVNHDYKLIFIRNRKAASTTVLDTFKVACKRGNKQLCLHYLTAKDWAQQRTTPQQMWMDYFVVSSTRNPWARAASGFDYVQDRWPDRTGVCASPSFRAFCRDPYHMGKLGNLFRCGALSSFRGDDAWAYDFYHVEPAYHCMTDERGQLAVDFLIRYEHLQEDFLQLIDLLNQRRPQHLPAIQPGKMRWMKQNAQAVQDVQPEAGAAGGGSKGGASWDDPAALLSTERHARKYRQCGMECVTGLSGFYKADIELMRIQLPPQ